MKYKKQFVYLVILIILLLSTQFVSAFSGKNSLHNNQGVDLPDGYQVYVSQINVDESKVCIQIFKNGHEKTGLGFLDNKSTYYYEQDGIVILIELQHVFQGMVGPMATIYVEMNDAMPITEATVGEPILEAVPVGVDRMLVALPVEDVPVEKVPVDELVEDLPTDIIDFDTEARIGKLKIKGAPEESFWYINSNIAAYEVGKMYIGYAQTTNEESSFGAAFAEYGTFTYSDDQLYLINEIKRVLRVGGILYISDLLINTDRRNISRL